MQMNKNNCSGCLPITRLDVIKSIIDWIASKSENQKKVLWLCGLVRSRKSMLSMTITWMMQDLDHLGAFFFFNHNIPERNAATLIRTQAYQLAVFNCHIGNVVSQIVERFLHIAEC